MPFPDPPSNKTPASTPPPPPSLGITPLSGTKMSTLPSGFRVEGVGIKNQDSRFKVDGLVLMV
jgi:hypothetical protein